MGFVHLHLHTQYSLLDGANKVSNLMPQVAAYDMPAVAMTDHGNMFGAVDFYRTAAQHGVKPIIGCEVYVAPHSRFDKNVSGADNQEHGGNFHLVLLAMNLDGYRNLCRLVTAGYTDGFYRKPRVDKALLRELNSGIIALSGCLSGELARTMLGNREKSAREVAEEYAAIFDERFYIEIQANHLPQQEQLNPALIELARELSLPLVATNDCHYLHAEDAEAHEVLLCVQSGKVMSDDKRWRLGTNQLYVKSPEVMRAEFADHPQALDATLDIAERCNLELSFGEFKFPVFAIPEHESLEQHLERVARQGLEERLRLIRDANPEFGPEAEQEYRQRLAFELKVIGDMGFAGYFLIVSDFILYAKSQGIPVGPGRGSAAGSLVAYCLQITDVDPIRYQLLFERFLNPGRKSMPDIDVDFCFERRDEVIQYIKDKYGSDKVAQIITFGTLKGKQAIKDVGRALEFSFGETDRMAKLYPAPKQGKDFPLEAALDMEPRLREIRTAGQREEKLFAYSLKLEGLLRHASKHAAGLVISPTALVDHLPLFVDKEGSVLTQFAGPDVDAIGLIKFDFLGLKTLTLLANTVSRIKKTRGREINLSTLPLDDATTYRKLTHGDTVGVFQMEGSGIRKLITQLKPSCFEDIIAVIALFRPGPLDSGAAEQFIRRKHGKEPTTYPHKLLEPVLKETYGVTIYQEQVMQIAQVLAGYSLADADSLRRAMGKKKKEVMQEERGKFLAGAKHNRIPEKTASEIFNAMETFAAYGFNKSHAAAYALVAYQTAWFKANHPVEFYAASMSFDMGNADRIANFRRELQHEGIALLPPDVNRSGVAFTVEDGAVRYALAALKNVGAAAMESLVRERETQGRFRDVGDLADRLGTGVVNKRQMEHLIKAGALDTLNPNRRQLFEGVDAITRLAAVAADDRSSNQVSLFGDDPAVAGTALRLPDVPDWPLTDRLRHEFEAVGVYLSAHPLDSYTKSLEKLKVVSYGRLVELAQAGEQPSVAKLAGTVIGRKERRNAKGNKYAFVQLSDSSGIYEVTAFSEALADSRDLLDDAAETNAPVLVNADIRIEDGDSVRLLVRSFSTLDSAAARSTRGFRIYLGGDEAVGPLHGLLVRERGGHGTVDLVVPWGGREAEIRLGTTIPTAPAIHQAIKSIPGVVHVEEV